MMKLTRLLIAIALLISGGLLMLPLTLAVGTYAEHRSHLDNKEHLVNLSNRGVTLLDRHQQPFFTFYQGKPRESVPLKRIAPIMQQAVIATEDHTFYHHRGFSWRGIARSALANLRQGRLVAGGSTITQQLVKNSLLGPRKSLIRKYEEVVLAAALEQRHSKDEILEMYLNTVYFGEGAIGIENASKRYFGKPAQDLSLAEASLLTAALPSPSILTPFGKGAARLKERQALVLAAMQRQGMISSAEAAATLAAPPTLQRRGEPQNTIAPHFALMVRDALLMQYSEKELAQSGFKITTTLDLAWQQQAEAALRQHVDGLASQKVLNGAVVALDPTSGAILALVGSKDWHDPTFGTVNMATTPRQTGSAFKPIVYATAFEQQTITAATTLQDRPTTFGKDYRPKNFDRRFRGTVLPRRALANSLNVPAVEVLDRTGVAPTVAAAKNLGIHTLDHIPPDNLALALGAAEIPLVELTSAYGAFAVEGKHYPSYVIAHITDKFDRQIFTTEAKPKTVFSPGTAFMISSILSDANSRREVFGTALNLSRPAAVKTGTVDQYRGAWTVGYTPQVVVGVWIGNNDNSPMHRVAGSLGAAPLWRSLMETFLADQPVLAFTPPSSLIALAVCRGSGLPLKYQGRGGYTEYFVAGTEPRKYCQPQPSATPTPDAVIAEQIEDIRPSIKKQRPLSPLQDDRPDKRDKRT